MLPLQAIKVEEHLAAYLTRAVEAIRSWEASYGDFEPHPSLALDPHDVSRGLDDLTDRLSGNYPFFHPHYAGQMLKPPHPGAIVAYVAAMLINPNNHALDGGPPTSEMEKEAVLTLSDMIGMSGGLGHLTTSGTIANLEALWISRELKPGKAIVFSSDAHYTHARMCGLLGIEGRAVPANELGEMCLNSLETELGKGDVGAVVATAGTTGYGAIDDIPAILALCRRHDVRVHVDAAYGGFFRVLADDAVISAESFERLKAIAVCDSVVIDPHKHGLQPYGCGAVVFRDPAVGRIYQHDSPYTYFTSDDLHLGEISLECSRAGAAAAALWFTLRLIPLERDRGFGPILHATRRAAIDFADVIKESNHFKLFRAPELDIVTFYPAADRASEVDRLSAKLFAKLMNDRDDPIFLSLLKVDGSELERQGVKADIPSPRILRTVLMKPEHEHAVPHIARRIFDEIERIRGEA